MQTSHTTTHARERHTDQDRAVPTENANAAQVTQAQSLSSSVRGALESRLGSTRTQRYLTNNIRLTDDAQGIRLEAPDRFTLDMIERRIGDDLRDTVRELSANTNASVSFSVSETKTSNPRPRPGDERSITTKIAPDRDRAPARRSPQNRTCPDLGSFVVGQSNELAYGAVIRAIAPQNPNAPVLIHGSCGVGKTHLLRAAAQQFRNENPGVKVRCISGEAFTSSYVQAVRKRTIDAFERKFKDLDLLCLDDVHLIAGKEKTQHELLTIFDTLAISGARIILASDAPPHEIERFQASLASRLSGGIVARIDTPNADMGPELVRSLARRHSIELDDRGVGVLLDRVGIGHGATGRDIEGAVVQVQAVSSLLDGSARHATLSHISRAMDLRGFSSERLSASEPIPPSLAIACVCEELGVSREELAGTGRHKRVVLTRELCVHACKTLTTASFPEIARAMGRPNHSSVITARKRLLARIENEEHADVLGRAVPISELCEHLHRSIRARRRA